MAKNQLNLDEIHVATIKKYLREQGKEHTNQAAIDYALEIVAKQVTIYEGRYNGIPSHIIAEEVLDKFNAFFTYYESLKDRDQEFYSLREHYDNWLVTNK